MNQDFLVMVATSAHAGYAEQICNEMEESAKARGTGIAKRTPGYLQQLMNDGKAVIAFAPDGNWAGFCYIACWGDRAYVANSGLIISPDYRKGGLAKKIKHKIFELSRTKYPDAKVFGLTTGLAVMKINSELGYKPVTYSEITQDEVFWEGCKSCVNHEILMSKGRKNCLCTAMLYDPQANVVPVAAATPPAVQPAVQKTKKFQTLSDLVPLKFLKNLKKTQPSWAAVTSFFVTIFVHKHH